MEFSGPARRTFSAILRSATSEAKSEVKAKSDSRTESKNVWLLLAPSCPIERGPHAFSVFAKANALPSSFFNPTQLAIANLSQPLF